MKTHIESQPQTALTDFQFPSVVFLGRELPNTPFDPEYVPKWVNGILDPVQEKGRIVTTTTALDLLTHYAE